jgi:CheY-like chemotaxis protein
MNTDWVLLVDDSELVLSLMTESLEGVGIRAVGVGSWQALDDSIAQARPAVILMDVNMPELTGDFALRFFRESRELGQTQLLLMSDIDEAELARRAEDAGADGYVSKNWGIARMVESVQHAMDRVRTR